MKHGRIGTEKICKIFEKIRKPSDSACVQTPARQGFSSTGVADGLSFLPGISMHRKWIKLWRKLEDSAVFRDSSAYHVFTYLLLRAQFASGRYSCTFEGVQIYLESGQVVTGRKQISQKTGLPESTVRDALKRLERRYNIIRLNADNKATLVTLLNWDTYQNEPPDGRQQTDTKQECKERKNKEYSTHVRAPRSHTIPLEEEAFEKFWRGYPNKIAKKKAVKAWNKSLAGGATPKEIIHGLEKYIPIWKNKEKQYIPHPATWLNAGRWDDEIEEKKDDSWSKSFPNATQISKNG